MLFQFIVYTTFGAFCVEDDSELGACEIALLNAMFPEYERVIAVKKVNVNCYPY
jgi:hypothetical protein